jgi:hypothetical protein
MGVSHADRRRQEEPRGRESATMRGRAHVYAQARISAEDIIPLQHRNGGAEVDLGRHALAGIDPGFPGRVDAAVKNLTKGECYRFAPLTPFAMEVLEAGGLLPYVLRQTTGASSA